MIDQDTIKCDVTVIGAGISGMAATLFAVNRGLSVAQVGSASEIGFASGLIDLLGVHPIKDGKGLNDPWAGIDALKQDIPQHPYARLNEEEINAALNELLGFLQDAGLPYHTDSQHNIRIITPMGTVKTTYAVPQTMWGCVEAFRKKEPCLLVDFEGLKGFSAGMIATAMRDKWPDIKTARIVFPGTEQMDEVLPEHMANALVISENREKLARRIKEHVKDSRPVGLPAILGLFRSVQVADEMAELIGVPVFEIPTMPPSIPGLRLKEAFERGLREKRPYYFPQSKVFNVDIKNNEGFTIHFGRMVNEREIISKGVILATGRFIGGGLNADRKRVRETVFNLSVFQPENRTQWHRENLFDPLGHQINLAGLETDNQFRPLNDKGQPVFKNLYAAGSILAHQDWKRMKCGVGLAAATAYGAVKAFTNESTD